MNKLKQYALMLFLIENLAAQTRFLGAFTGFFFYFFLACGAVFMFDAENWSKESIAKYGWCYLLMLVMVVYEFLVGIDYINSKTLMYLFAKISTFFIIITGINTDFDLYNKRIFIPVSVCISVFLLYGLITGDMSGSDVGRMTIGFGNANTTGSVGASLVGFMLFYSKDNEWNVKMIIMLLIGLYAVLMSGSRAAVFMLIVIFFFRYGFSSKTIALSLIFAFVLLIIIPALHMNVVGFERFFGTITGAESTNRDAEREATIVMIKERPFVGWGFQAENQGRALLISEMGSHNGYLDLAKFMGIPMAICYMIPIIITFLRYIKAKLKFTLDSDLYMALVFGLMIKATVESLLHGVHEFDTNLFYVSMAILSTRIYSLNNNTDFDYAEG